MIKMIMILNDNMYYKISWLRAFSFSLDELRISRINSDEEDCL